MSQHNSQGQRICRRRRRWKFGADHLSVLETCYARNPYPSAEIGSLLAAQLAAPESSVKMWFVNRRRRDRRVLESRCQSSEANGLQPNQYRVIPFTNGFTDAGQQQLHLSEVGQEYYFDGSRTYPADGSTRPATLPGAENLHTSGWIPSAGVNFSADASSTSRQQAVNYSPPSATWMQPQLMSAETAIDSWIPFPCGSNQPPRNDDDFFKEPPGQPASQDTCFPNSMQFPRH